MNAILAAGTLIIFSGTSHALPPINTAYPVVQMNSNGVFAGTATNLIQKNGIARTQDVITVSGNLIIVSNLAVSGIASAAVAQATAMAAMSTGVAAQVSASSALFNNAALAQRVTAIETNYATADQGALSDTALQPTSYAPNVGVGITFNDTNTLYAAPWFDAGGYGVLLWQPEGNRYLVCIDGVWNRVTWSGSQWEIRVSEVGSLQYHGGATLTNQWYVDAGVPPAPTVTYGPITNTAQAVLLELTAHIASQIRSSWHTNQVLAPGGVTNTIIYLGAP